MPVEGNAEEEEEEERNRKVNMCSFVESSPDCEPSSIPPLQYHTNVTSTIGLHGPRYDNTRYTPDTEPQKKRPFPFEQASTRACASLLCRYPPLGLSSSSFTLSPFLYLIPLCPSHARHPPIWMKKSLRSWPTVMSQSRFCRSRSRGAIVKRRWTVLIHDHLHYPKLRYKTGYLPSMTGLL